LAGEAAVDQTAAHLIADEPDARRDGHAQMRRIEVGHADRAMRPASRSASSNHSASSQRGSANVQA
jgi:hypothetical protein